MKYQQLRAQEQKLGEVLVCWSVVESKGIMILVLSCYLKFLRDWYIRHSSGFKHQSLYFII